MVRTAHATQEDAEVIRIDVVIDVEFGILAGGIVLVHALTRQACLKVTEILLSHVVVVVIVIEVGRSRRRGGTED